MDATGAAMVERTADFKLGTVEDVVWLSYLNLDKHDCFSAFHCYEKEAPLPAEWFSC